MIIEVTKENKQLITLLESNFSHVYKKDEIIKRFLNNSFTKVFIYLKESNIIGYVNYDFIYDRFEIINIEVLKEYRNKSIGSKLLEHVINIAINEKVKNITLEVRTSNKNAIRLYKKYGFIEKAIRRNYYKEEDGLLMEKGLVR